MAELGHAHDVRVEAVLVVVRHRVQEELTARAHVGTARRGHVAEPHVDGSAAAVVDAVELTRGEMRQQEQPGQRIFHAVQIGMVVAGEGQATGMAHPDEIEVAVGLANERRGLVGAESGRPVRAHEAGIRIPGFEERDSECVVAQVVDIRLVEVDVVSGVAIHPDQIAPVRLTRDREVVDPMVERECLQRERIGWVPSNVEEQQESGR